jgi:hypothetical protein
VSTSEPPYDEGERGVWPPAKPFDAAEVAGAARQQDPGLPPETASLLAGQAWAELTRLGELDAPALARALMAGNPGVGATPCNVVAAASVSFCELHDLHPG